MDWADGADETVASSEMRSYTITAQQHGQRLDRVLAQGVAEFSRSYLQQLVEMGLVTLNQQVARKAAQKVKAGDALQVELRPTPQSQAFQPEPMALNVVYEDADILVIDKPAGLVVHPAPGHWRGTLLNGLLARHACFGNVPRAGIVHRLDKDTSGLMVVARSREAMDGLVRDIAARKVSRQYLAAAQGAWSLRGKHTVEAPIGRDPRNRLRMAVVDLAQHAGKTAKTDFVCLANAAQFCLLQCILHTGRTHQIRVHVASLGHALVGDAVYAGPCDAGMERQALHAFRLAFTHPIKGELMKFESALPPDFQNFLHAQGLLYNASSLAPC